MAEGYHYGRAELLIDVNLSVYNDCDVSAVVEKLHYLFPVSR